MVWALSVAFIAPLYFLTLKVKYIFSGVCFLPPLPLLILSLIGILKALSASRVPSDEKRRIVGTLVLVLLIYMLLFLPKIIWFLAEGARDDFTFSILTLMLLRFSPLADVVLYIFMRKGIIDHLLASVCCCRMDSDDASSVSNDTSYM